MSTPDLEAGTPKSGKPVDPHAAISGISWVCTAVTLAAYFLLMLTVAFAPDAITRPIVEGGVTSVALVAGVAALVILVGVSTYFTLTQNRREPHQ
ncbi:MAG: DUF485 domain-containing protein [Rhodobacteraceae bacterium]|nr:DUF485 domain-containing protein [Paracoccaceae bacterium]